MKGAITISMSEVPFTGYVPGVSGKITEAHGVYYHENWGLDISFEIQVGSELSEFLARFQPGRDGLWVGNVAGAFAGSVAIDGSDAGTQGARLRWFIVTPALQGRGIGKTLLEKSVQFCKEVGYTRVFLWTFEGLKTARYLYESVGFCVSEEHEVRQWGREIKEQRFDLTL
jgi:GNAT superfamily N-acetyltransferase